MKAEQAGRGRDSKTGNHELRKKRHDVATSLRGRDRIKGSTMDNEVVTPNRSHNIRFTIDWTLMSQHLEEVTTSTLNQKLSRHQLAKKIRSRHHSVVVTSVRKKEGRDIIPQ